MIIPNGCVCARDDAEYKERCPLECLVSTRKRRPLTLVDVEHHCPAADQFEDKMSLPGCCPVANLMAQLHKEAENDHRRCARGCNRYIRRDDVNLYYDEEWIEEMSLQAQQAMRRLTDTQRRRLYWRDELGYTLREIAQYEGVTATSVCQSVQAARVKFAKYYY